MKIADILYLSSYFLSDWCKELYMDLLKLKIDDRNIFANLYKVVMKAKQNINDVFQILNTNLTDFFEMKKAISHFDMSQEESDQYQKEVIEKGLKEHKHKEFRQNIEQMRERRLKGAKGCTKIFKK